MLRLDTSRARLGLVVGSLALGLVALAPAPTRAAPSTASAAPPDRAEWDYQVHLLTVGPGSALTESGGYALLTVGRVRPGHIENQVYGFGELEAREASAWSLLSGSAELRILRLGTVSRAVAPFAAANRDVQAQRLSLSASQIGRLRERLRQSTQLERLAYPHHLLRANAVTRLRDLLDEVLGGALRQQLASRASVFTLRQHAHSALAGHLGARLLVDLFGGRILEQPLDGYCGVHQAVVLAQALRLVMVPAPTGSGRVPLAEPPRPVSQRKGASAASESSLSPSGLALLLAGLLLIWAVAAAMRSRSRPRWSAAWLAVGPGLLGLLGAALLGVGSLSEIAEARANELWLSYPATDALVLFVALGWSRRRPGLLLLGYAIARTALATLVLAGHASGLLYQQPRAMIVPGIVCAVGLLVLVITKRRAEREREGERA